MSRSICLAMSVLLVGVTATAEASDHNGIYALIENVVIRDAGTPNETVQVLGLFSLAKGQREYQLPVHGYMFFKLIEGKEDVCRKEWADLKRVAGTKLPISFARRFERNRDPANLGRIRKLHEKPTKPDTYVLHYGVRKMRRGSTYTPLRNLEYAVTPNSPAEGAGVDPGKLTLVANRVAANNEKVKYFFSVKYDKITVLSPPLTPGKNGVEWTPKFMVGPGQWYIWKTWVEFEQSTGDSAPRTITGPVTTHRFDGKPAK